MVSQAGPTSRFAHSMAYDPARQAVVLFGGYNGGYSSETWTWNGTTWAPLPGLDPAPRFYATLQEDAANQTLLLIGGRFGGSGALSDQWDLSLGGWTRRADAFIGGPILFHAAASSPLGEMLVSGGQLGGTTVSSTTWVGTPFVEPTRRPLSAGMQLTVRVPPGTGYGYRWRQNGQNLFNTPGLFSGVTTRTLTLVSTDPSLAGTYDCDITNACGTTVSAATVIYCPADFNGDGFQDFFDYDDFVAAFEVGDPRTDVNQDGFLDFFDYDEFVLRFEVGC